MLPTLRVSDLTRLLAGGAWVVDVRPPEAFAESHVPGSVSIPLRPQFASWLGWVVPEDAALVFVLDADQDREDLVHQARKVGHEQLLGELDGGIAAWMSAGRSTSSIPVAPAESAGGLVVDVRQNGEYLAAHIPRARNVELGSISEADLPAEPLAVMCGHGERAMTAASLLARGGRDDVTVLIGGPEDWSRDHGVLDTGA